MSNFNYLSGSSVDNNTEMLFELFASDKCYLGFSHGMPDLQWGLNALVNISASGVSAIQAPNSSSDNDAYYYSLRTTGMNDANKFLRKVYIASVTNGTWTFLPEPSVGTLYLSFINSDWAMVSGFKKDYFNFMTPVSGTEYFLMPSNTTAVTASAIPIINKQFRNLPYYTTNCTLMYETSPGGGYAVAASGLQKTVNILGETYVTGMHDNVGFFSDAFTVANANKAAIKATKFQLIDTSSNPLLIEMAYVDEAPGNLSQIYTEGQFVGGTSKYVTLRYKFTNAAASAVTQLDYQYLKFMVGPNGADELAVWNEAFPFDSVIPVADAYPPALDISYLKNPSLSTSIFDVRGLTKISPASGDVFYMKQLMSQSEADAAALTPLTVEDIQLDGPMTEHIGYTATAVSGGATVIPMNNFHTFVVGDTINIPNAPTSGDTSIITAYSVCACSYVIGAASITLNQILVFGPNEYLPVNFPLVSLATTVVAKISIAKTSNKAIGLKYGCTNVLINKSVPNVGPLSPTENIYRQLFVCYNPQSSGGGLITDSVVNGDNRTLGAIYQTGTMTENIGMLLFLSNTVAFYRKYALGGAEQAFQIII
jgi:hypothetical protein